MGFLSIICGMLLGIRRCCGRMYGQAWVVCGVTGSVRVSDIA